MKHLSLLLMIVIELLCVPFVYAQKDVHSDRIPPAWAEGYYRELPYSYIEVVSAMDSNQNIAREKALRSIVERRNLASGARFDVKVSDGNIIVSGNESLTVKARIIDEYAQYENNEWHVSLLVQTCKNQMYTYETLRVSDKYPMTAKSFVPGMMQLEKNQMSKGLIMIGTEVAMISGIVAFETLRSSYVAKISSTHNTSARISYINSANTYSDLRNICIAGATAAYLWSFIDAVACKGPRHLIIADAELSLFPIAGLDYTGLALNINL